MILAERPLCEVCGRGAHEVHHSPPVSGPDDPRFFDPSAVVGLCKSCHSAATMKMLNEQRKA
jgi:5-methylcytosine-specific restriction endonuclease McrA